MKNLLFVTNYSSHGGAEKMLIWLANHLAQFDQDYNVFFCILHHDPPFYTIDKKIHLINYFKDSSDNFLYRNTIALISKTRYLYKVIKQNNIDLVINFNDHSLYNILICKLMIKFKLLISQRVDPNAIQTLTGKIRLKLIHYADGLICQTNEALEFFKDYKLSVKHVIFNPVIRHPKKLWSLQDSQNVILCVARIELKQKRQDVLINAFEIVHKYYPDFSLQLYGDKIENDYQILLQMVNSKGLDKYVKYCGVTNDIYNVMQKSRLLVLSSDYEGIPNAILEGMAVGMPIISTDCKPGGARMLLNPDKGIVVDTGDYRQLAKGIMKLIEDNELCIKLSKNALCSLDRFEENTITEEWRNIIEELV